MVELINLIWLVFVGMVGGVFVTIVVLPFVAAILGMGQNDEGEEEEVRHYVKKKRR